MINLDIPKPQLEPPLMTRPKNGPPPDRRVQREPTLTFPRDSSFFVLHPNLSALMTDVDRSYVKNPKNLGVSY